MLSQKLNDLLDEFTLMIKLSAANADAVRRLGFRSLFVRVMRTGEVSPERARAAVHSTAAVKAIIYEHIFSDKKSILDESLYVFSDFEHEKNMDAFSFLKNNQPMNRLVRLINLLGANVVFHPVHPSSLGMASNTFAQQLGDVGKVRSVSLTTQRSACMCF